MPGKPEFRAAQDRRPCRDYSQLRRATPEVTEWNGTGSKPPMGPHALLVVALFVASNQTAAGGQATSPLQSAPGAPATASNSEAYFLFLQGHMAEGDGDVAGAIDAYKQAITAAPQSA